MNIEKNEWLNIRQAAEYVGMSVGFMRKATHNHLVPHTRVGTKALRFSRESLDEWLTANSSGGEMIYPKHEGR